MVGKTEKTCGADKHIGDATCLLFHNGHLYSSGADGLIKVIDLRSVSGAFR